MSEEREFKVGDFVDMGDHKGLKVVEVDAEPRYTVEWMGGHRQRVKESTLKPYQPVPVVCGPDGTRCASWRSLIEPARIFVGATQVNQDAFRVCPWCGERLRKEA